MKTSTRSHSAPQGILDLVKDWQEEQGCPGDLELDRYREGGVVSEGSRKLIEKHLASCLICRAYVRHGRGPGREKRGQVALRRLLDGLRHIWILIVGWLVLPSRAKAASALPYVALLPPFGLALVALAVHGFSAASTVGGATIPFSSPATGRTMLSAGPTELPSPVPTAGLWRTPSSRPAVLAMASASVGGNGSHSPRAAVTIALLRIGNTSVEAAADKGASSDAVPMSVHRFDTLTVRVSSPVPSGAHVYAAIRQNGGQWEVSDGVEPPDRKSALRLACRFGSQSDDLALFDVRVLVDRENLSPGPIPDALLTNRGVLAISPIFRVQRVSLNRPALALTHINGDGVWDGRIPWVYDESGIHVYASKLPIGARIGIVVQPTRPLNDNRWIQVDELDGSGTIDSHWGDPGLHSFVRFAVSAFAVGSEKDFPPRGVPIAAQEWAAYSAKFLSLSPPVTVVKAGDHFTIEALNDRLVPLRGRAVAEPQADIRGLLDRPIASGERVWLVCAPGDADAGKPWIAGATIDGFDNLWIAKAVQLWKRGQPSSFDLLAVLSAEDPTKIDPSRLREWANSFAHTVNHVSLQIAESHTR